MIKEWEIIKKLIVCSSILIVKKVELNDKRGILRWTIIIKKWIFTNIGVSFILLGAITDILFTSRAKKTEQN